MSILMPESLTAENGAKYRLLGEIKVQKERVCECCYGDESLVNYCEECDKAGYYTEEIFIDWTTIKELYAKIVADVKSGKIKVD